MANGTPLGNMVVKLGLDSSSFGDSVTAANRAVRYFTNEVKAMDNVMKLTGKSSDGLSAKQKSLKNAIESQSKALKKLEEDFKKVEPNTPAYEALANKIQAANVKMASFEGQLKQVNVELLNTAKEVASSTGLAGGLNSLGDKAIAAGNKLDQIGDKMRPVSTILTAGFALATNKAMDFEGQMNTVKSLLADTIPNAEDLGKATEEMGEKSKGWAKQYGISTSSINNGMEELIKKGFDMNETIAAMPAILDASKASGDDFGIVMDSASSILRQFGLEAKDTGRVTDGLTFVANKTSSGFADLGEAMKYVGPVAKATGNTLEDTAAAVGILSDAGILGSQAGTALKTSLLRLSQISTDKMVAQFSELLNVAGKGAKPLVKAWEESVPAIQNAKNRLTEVINLGGTKKQIKDAEEGITAAYGGIKTAFEKMSLPDQVESLNGMKKEWLANGRSLEDYNEIITTLVGKESLPAMMTLIDKGGESIKSLSKETGNATGYTKKLADELGKSSKNGVERFKSSLEVLQITIGQKLLPTLAPLVERINDTIDGFLKLPKPIQSAGVGLAGFLALGYPALNFLGGASKALGIASKGFGELATGIKLASGLKDVGLAANAASGMGGLAGLGAALAPAAPVIIGLGALAIATGIGVKAFQEMTRESRESKSRIEQWGTDVGSHADEAMDKVQKLGQETGTAMQLTAQGFSDATPGMVENLKEIGSTLENSILDKQVSLDAMISKMPETIQESLRKIIEDQTKIDNEALAKIKDNQAEISNIQKTAAENGGEYTAQQLKLIQNLATDSANAYVSTLNVTEKEAGNILDAMTGDVAKATKAQGSEWLSNLGKQRQGITIHYSEMREEMTNELKAQGLENTKIGNQMLAALEDSQTSATQLLDGQMAAILEKYPELSEEIFLTNGQMISSTNEYAKEMIAENKRVAESFKTLTVLNGKNAEEFQKKTELMATETGKMSEKTSAFVKSWNALVLDDKKVNIDTNAQAKINEATKSREAWDELVFGAKDASLKSNARIMIAEAAVANGYWDDLPFTEKQALIKSDATLKVEEALMASGKWQEMTLEQKNAILASNTPEKIATTMLELGLWQEFVPMNKKLKAENFDVLNKIATSEKTLNQYNNLPVELKTMIVDNTLSNSKIVDSGELIKKYNAIDPELKKLLADKFNLDTTIQAATGRIGDYERLHPQEKKLTASDQTGSGVNSAVNTINQVKDKTATITTIHQDLFAKPTENYQGAMYAKGSNYHKGGLAMVNDQAGRLYKEMVTLPNGRSFVPEGRNVVLDLPRGSKVLTAQKTAPLIPKYAKGIGKQIIPANGQIFRDMEKAQKAPNLTTVIQNKVDGGILQMIVKALQGLKQGNVEQKIIIENVTWTGKEDITELLHQLANQELINARGGLV
ncbi:hypothetical protein Hs30E_12960 [Lactococcus hodotermopsidis]|uniref:Phage tail tape measure protein domain-containing protein n=1 Tax=Pseudolactococcus hodotermopsidis TaxID=2709157 RepID=A0A6A0BDJ5_9LACT|nr:phage tail tape measure protein [Lactococcus hodotermopsidis]GFH42745.1 hypothetical protein Hs30E_12960 [Lactococcus hodotermopsidis]